MYILGLILCSSEKGLQFLLISFNVKLGIISIFQIKQFVKDDLKFISDLEIMSLEAKRAKHNNYPLVN